jgi:hypothetical protein
VRLRLALESLGPIFVKFGQLLSVRPDLIPEDIAAELAKLQDEVPPFPWEQVEATLDAAYARPHAQLFRSFERVPIASASVAQVHFAVLPDGREAAVKVLRPGIRSVIDQDVALLRVLAGIAERTLPDGPRLRPRAVVAEFEKTIADELDLVREAANASQLRRNFADGRLLIVPEVFWDWCNRDVMVMERIHGIPVNALALLRREGIDIPSSRATAWRSSSRRCSATASSTPTCTPATSSSRATGATAASTSASWERSPTRTRLPRHELHGVLPPRLPSRGARLHRGGLGAARHARRRDSRAPSGPCASRSSTGR